MKEQSMGLQYLVIPAELFVNDELTYQDMIVFYFIRGLDQEHGCYASNLYLAKLARCSEAVLKASIKKLKEHGYLQDDFVFDGRRRVLRVNPEYIAMYKDDVAKYNAEIDSYRASSFSSRQPAENQAGSQLENSLVISNSNKHREKESFLKEGFNEPGGSSASSTESPVDQEKRDLNIALASPEVLDILAYWKEMGGKVPAKGTCQWNKDVEIINKLLTSTRRWKLFTATKTEHTTFTVEHIKQAIFNYSKATLDPAYEPANKRFAKKVGYFADFVLREYGEAGRFGRSLFLYYLNRSPVPVAEDTHPKTTARLKQLYKERVRGDRDTQFSPEENLDFIKASNAIHEYIKKNRAKMSMGYLSGGLDVEAGTWLFEAVFSSTKDKSVIRPFWLHNEVAFNDQLPKYLYKNAIIGNDYMMGRGY